MFAPFEVQTMSRAVASYYPGSCGQTTRRRNTAEGRFCIHEILQLRSSVPTPPASRSPCLGVARLHVDDEKRTPNRCRLRLTGITTSSRTNLLLRWEGGVPPFRIQMRTNLNSSWVDVTPQIYSSNHTMPIPTPAGQAMFRVRTVPDSIAPFAPSGVTATAVSPQQITSRGLRRRTTPAGQE